MQAKIDLERETREAEEAQADAERERREAEEAAQAMRSEELRFVKQALSAALLPWHQYHTGRPWLTGSTDGVSLVLLSRRNCRFKMGQSMAANMHDRKADALVQVRQILLWDAMSIRLQPPHVDSVVDNRWSTALTRLQESKDALMQMMAHDVNQAAGAAGRRANAKETKLEMARRAEMEQMQGAKSTKQVRRASKLPKTGAAAVFAGTFPL